MRRVAAAVALLLCACWNWDQGVQDCISSGRCKDATGGSGGTGGGSGGGVAGPVAPDAPTEVMATAGNQLAHLTWSAPANNGGSPIINYAVVSDPPTRVVTVTDTATDITGLTNGTSYTFTVKASNVAGQSPASVASNAVTPLGVPGAPTSVTATAGNAAALVQWSAPVDTGGTALTGFVITSSPDNVSTTVAGDATMATLMGLTNGTSYTFTVKARNSVGDGPASSPSNAVTPVVVSQPPTNVSAIAGNMQATVSWTPPTDTGGKPISSYTVTSSPDGVTAVAGPSSTQALVMGLTNGTAYTFTVKVTTSVGDSLPSTPSSPVTPATVPDAPTAVTAMATSGQASVMWAAPASNGGAAVTQYTVTSSPDSITATSATTQTTVTGLTNGKSYTFTVRATNRVGDSNPSLPSSAVTPLGVPGAPTGVFATAGNAQAMISWTPPADNGGTGITSYTVTASPGGVMATTSMTSVVVMGLTNGTAYTFTVTATNAVGTGPASSASGSVTPATVPGAPTNVVAAGGPGQASVQWTPPASTGGAAITGYTVTSNPGGLTASTTGATMATVVGLTNGTAYTFIVTATNSAGIGAPSAASNAVTPGVLPGAPHLVSALGGDTRATIRWQPGSPGSSPLTSYTVTSAPGALTVSVPALQNRAVITGLTNGTAYTFTVKATSAVGTGSTSSPSNAVTPGPACSGALVLGELPLVTVGSSPQGLVRADFNGDGKADVAVADWGTTNTVTLLLGKGNGTFQRVDSATTDAEPVALVAADFNGDGKLDLATANMTGNDVSILIGNGMGGFAGTNYPAGTNLRSIAAADFNGDLKLDLVVANYTGAVNVLLGNGNGTFGTASAIGVGNAAQSVATGDFNADNKQDLVFASSGTTTLSVMLGNGNGTFAAQTDLTLTANPYDVAVADMNGDNKPDLIATSGSGVNLLIGNGNGTFQAATVTGGGPHPYGLTVADLNADGKRDVAVCNGSGAVAFSSVSVLFGNGNGTFQPVTTYPAPGDIYSELTSGDFNGDGVADLVSTDRSSHVTTLLGQGDGGFARLYTQSTGTFPALTVTGDFDGDGVADLAVRNSTGFSTLKGNGDGTLQAAQSYAMPAGPNGMVTADLNADGRMDLAVATLSNTQVFLAAAGGTLGGGVPYPSAPGNAIAVADLNGDSLWDLAVASTSSGKVNLLFGVGDGTFTPGSTLDGGSFQPVSIAACDFDNDGKLDLVQVAQGTGNNVSLLMATGGGAFRAPVTFAVGSNLSLIACADLNGDAKPDLVGGAGNLAVRLGQGDGGFATASTFSSLGGVQSLALEDFNGDGHLDVACVGAGNTALIALLAGLGDGGFAPGVQYATPAQSGYLAADDFNRDGRLDLSASLLNASSVALLPNSACIP